MTQVLPPAIGKTIDRFGGLTGSTLTDSGSVAEVMENLLVTDEYKLRIRHGSRIFDLDDPRPRVVWQVESVL